MRDAAGREDVSMIQALDRTKGIVGIIDVSVHAWHGSKVNKIKIKLRI